MALRDLVATDRDFEQAVLDVVASIPSGETMTYGEVATDAGFPGAARAVGSLLRTTAADVPWWRVVAAGGKLTAPSWERQADRLAIEGHRIQGRRIKR